jgi:hypothetical protein
VEDGMKKPVRVSIMLSVDVSTMEPALLQTHVNVQVVGQDMIVRYPCVIKYAITKEIALYRTHVHVKEDGLDMTARYLCVLKNVKMVDHV